MDYTRPSHVPTADELAAAERTENRGLIAFAVLVIIATLFAALAFGSHIAF